MPRCLFTLLSSEKEKGFHLFTKSVARREMVPYDYERFPYLSPNS